MKKAKTSYRKTTALLAFVAMVTIQGMSSGAGARSLAGATDADLTPEKRTLKSFADDLTVLEKKCAELAARPTINSQEFSSTKTSADGLKIRVSQIQQAIRSVINKLKAAGQWDNFDSIALARLRDERDKSAIRDAGGAKRILEDGASQLGGLSQELEALVQPLGSKVRAGAGGRLGDEGARDLRSRVVRVSFSSPAPMFGRLRCAFRIVVNLVDFTAESNRNRRCACGNELPGDDCR